MAVITDHPNLAADQALDEIRNRHKRIKALWLANRSAFLAPVPANKVLDVFMHLGEHIVAIEAAIATPGIVDYARLIYGDATREVSAEVTAALDAAKAVKTWIITSWNAATFRYVTLAEDNSRTIHTFSADQVSGLVTRMDAFVALID